MRHRHRTLWAGSILCLLTLAVTQLTAEVRTLTILHTNDLHSRLTPLDSRRGGFAYLASVIRHERGGCVGCILLNAGDIAQGSPVSTIYKGMPIFEVANLLRFDAATLGNHDFDYGWQQTRNFIAMAKYPIVSSNIVDSNGALLTPKPWVILKANRLRVGVIGAMTEDLHNLSFPVLLGDWHTSPIVATVLKYAAELRGQCDLIVLLAHITGDEEKQFLAVPGVPVIVSGHIHTGLDEPLSNQDHVLVRVKSYGEELGRLELRVDTETKAPVSWKWTKIPIESDKVAPTPAVARLVNSWEQKVTGIVDKPIATSNRQFSRAEVRKLLEEAMKEASGADIAFMNAGGVRDILPKGQILLRHIWNVMPFDNRVVYGTFKGRDLPAVVTAGREIEPDKDYRLAVSDFTAANQSSEENLRTTGLRFDSDAGLLRDALADLIRKRKVIE
jgi:2',3'-cyclic-nucleotide 2'-phosphodiesterase (5'-nucleotidase family)